MFASGKEAKCPIPANPQPSKPTAIGVLAIVLACIVLSGLVLVLAYRLDWTLDEIYIAMMTVTLVINLACLICWSPELIGRRTIPGNGTKTWDLALLVVLFVPALIAIFVVAVREADDGGWGALGMTWGLGLILFAAGWALINWSMVVNPFFEKTVRQ